MSQTSVGMRLFYLGLVLVSFLYMLLAQSRIALFSLVGAMIALGHAEGTLELTIGFVAVALAAGNAVGGYVATVRMLEMFKTSDREAK